MPKCVFERGSGQFIGGRRHRDTPHDPVTHIQLDLSDFPDERAERWDGATGVRPATAQEMGDFDDEEKNEEARREIDERKALKAIVLWVAQKHGLTPAQARAEVLAIYKSL